MSRTMPSDIVLYPGCGQRRLSIAGLELTSISRFVVCSEYPTTRVFQVLGDAVRPIEVRSFVQLDRLFGILGELVDLTERTHRLCGAKGQRD
jgi:hypothetical protein